MIGFGLRLTTASGREALARFVTTALAVTIGVTLLLAVLSGLRGVDAQNARYAWLIATDRSYAPPAAGVDPMWAAVRTDLFDSREITVVSVAPTGPNPPALPGLRAVPAAGEYALSPALAALVDAHPVDELRDRYGATRIAVLGNDALPGPGALVVVTGRSVADLATRPDAGRITSVNDVSPGRCRNCTVTYGVDRNGVALILGVVALAVLFPVLIFIGAATRLSAARREQRFAALRLVGATSRQVAVLSAVESTLAAATGTLLGFAGFFAVRPLVARIPFTGEAFFTGDLTLGPVQIIGVALGIPVAAALVARWSVRRVRVSPLGVTRRVTPRPPRPWGLLVLGVGLAWLAFFLVGPMPDDGVGQVAVYVPGFLVVMIGLVLTGPWATMLGARRLVRHARRPALLMAGRRLADDPGSGFRAVSGVVLALFVASVTVGVISTFAQHRGRPPADEALAGSMFQQAGGGSDPGLPVTPALLRDLTADPGVRGTAVFHRDPTVDDNAGYTELNALVACTDLARLPELGRCEPGAAVARADAYVEANPDRSTDHVWPASPLSTATIASYPVQTTVVRTDGSTAALERARTTLELAMPGEALPPHTATEYDTIASRQLLQYQQLATVVILTSLPIAGCSLAVSVVAGLADRRRPFSLLRLAGTSTRLLRRVIAWESVTPLLAGTVVAVAAGLGAAALFTEGQLGYPLTLPGASFWLLVGGGLVLALLVVASTFPLVERTTGPEVARND